MLDIKFIRDNQEVVLEAIKNKQMNVSLDHLLSLDDQRRKLTIETEALRSRRNEIAEKLKKGKDEKLIEESKVLKESLGKLDLELEEVEATWTEAMQQIPNIPLPEVPIGTNETENVVVKKWGEPTKFKFAPKDHLDLGETLDIIDMQRAAKVAGARFGYWKGGAARLELALMQFVFETLTTQETIKQIADTVEGGYIAKPFIPVIPPVIIKPEVYKRTGRLSEQDKEDKYHLDQDDLYLIGSAEHTLVTLHMDETLKEDILPLRYVGFSTCFRREAGSYGKDTRGMLRVHQFDKIEMESFAPKELSMKEHLFFVAIQEHLMQRLNLPYQLVMNCTGDMGKPNARQIDVETWIPAQNKYRETHSADYVTDFQARRLNTKVRRKSGETELLHTNDATAIAMPRALIAIMENYQQEDGSIMVPEVLRKYTGFDVIRKNG